MSSNIEMLNPPIRRSRRENLSAKKVENDIKEPKTDRTTPAQETDDADFDINLMKELDEDSIPSEDDVADEGEVDSLLKEKDMSIEELMAKYGMKIPSPKESSFLYAQRSRKRVIKIADNQIDFKKRKDDDSQQDPAEISELNMESNISSEPKLLEDDYFDAEEDGDDFTDGSDSDSADSENAESQSNNENAQDLDDSIVSDKVRTQSHNSSRLWCRALATNESPQYNSEDDEDYDPTADYERHRKEEIRLGPEFQVEIPESIIPSKAQEANIDFESRVEKECSLMWNPFNLPQAQVINYQKAYANASNIHIPEDNDDERALFHLLLSDYNTQEAIRRLDTKVFQHNGISNYLSTWTENECVSFEKGFALYGKNFNQIQDSQLRHRSVSELVQFYYLWKKTARYDEFSKAYRKDKKKPLHPGLTDFMDCLAHEQDMIAESLLNKATENQALDRLKQVSDSDPESPKKSNASLSVKCEEDNIQVTPTEKCISNSPRPKSVDIPAPKSPATQNDTC